MLFTPDAIQLMISSAVLSILHALLPNHWLPVIAIAEREKWSMRETLHTTFLASLAHAFSTILIGVIIAAFAFQLNKHVTIFTSVITPAILISMGLLFIWQHYHHRHFHIKTSSEENKTSKRALIVWFVIAMFFSPCLEIEAFFLAAGVIGWQVVVLISAIYLIVSVTGMVFWVGWAYRGIKKLNWHALEHSAGIIAGVILILTGLSFFIIHS
jgi:putative Mn2+ efflux pump MntP